MVGRAAEGDRRVHDSGRSAFGDLEFRVDYSVGRGLIKMHDTAGAQRGADSARPGTARRSNPDVPGNRTETLVNIFLRQTAFCRRFQPLSLPTPITVNRTASYRFELLTSLFHGNERLPRLPASFSADNGKTPLAGRASLLGWNISNSIVITNPCLASRAFLTRNAAGH